MLVLVKRDFNHHYLYILYLAFSIEKALIFKLQVNN